MLVMEEKKRGLAETNTEEPNRKKLALETNGKLATAISDDSDDGPVGPLTQQDVVNFQKEAIFRQMQVYKRDYELVSSQLERLQKQDNTLQRCFGLLSAWWDQLTDVVAPATDASDSDIPDSLLHFVFETDQDDNENDEKVEAEFSSVLNDKRRVIEARLGSVFKADRPADIKDLESALSELSAKYHQAKSENEILRQSRQNAIKELENITEKYREAFHQLDRAQSSTVRRTLVRETASIKTETASDDNDKSNNTDVNASDSKAATSKEYQQLLEELQSTKLALEEAQALVKKQTQHLNDQEESILELNKKVREAFTRLGNPSEHELSGCEAFQQLKLRTDDCFSRNSKLAALNDKLRNECAELVAGREAFEESIKEKYESKAKELESQAHKAEQDVARIRAARDDLISDLNIKKVALNDKVKSFAQLNDLITIREERIKTLEEEVKAFRGSSEETLTTNLDGASIEDLKKLVEKLQRQNKNLSAEIPGLEAAFAKAHSKATAKVFDTIETENKLNRLTAEKVKADEKYFGAMRSKDALSQEIGKLKGQLSKSAEMITNLKEAERVKSNRVASLDRQIQDMRNHLQGLERELESAKLKISEREKRSEIAYRQLDDANVQLGRKDELISEEVKARRAVETEVEKLKVQLETKRFTSGAGSSSEVQEQLEALRSIAMCSVCSKNWKNTCIKVCGHVFCYECAEDRLKARLRKCPNCNKQYSYNDLLSIHL